MANNKISPWPWRFEHGYIMSADDDFVAGGEPHEGWIEGVSPNHRLMCKSPEVLDALRGLVADAQAQGMRAEALDKAIALVEQFKGC